MRIVGCLAVWLGLLGADCRGQVRWRPFTSSAGFSLEYPSTWYRLTGSGAAFTILSSKASAEGVGLAQGQAAVSVTKLANTDNASLAELVNHDVHFDSLLSHQAISDSTVGNHDCIRAVFRSEEGPGAYEIDIGFYCRIAGVNFRVLLSSWQGDNRQTSYEWVARGVVRSIRTIR